MRRERGRRRYLHMPRTRGRDAPRPRPPVWEVLDAAATKPYGFMRFEPGPGMGSRIALFGVSYKPGVGDIREAPALKILTLLGALGADLRYHDPHAAMQSC